ncbi:hypothetical protein K438DRAFT_1927916 [Mycena galopus ATCC 62051]|nr:hypothetical protein K438DRAFT_1927916 [Mycena galopus ATCC 62051]
MTISNVARSSWTTCWERISLPHGREDIKTQATRNSAGEQTIQVGRRGASSSAGAALERRDRTWIRAYLGLASTRSRAGIPLNPKKDSRKKGRLSGAASCVLRDHRAVAILGSAPTPTTDNSPRGEESCERWIHRRPSDKQVGGVTAKTYINHTKGRPRTNTCPPHLTTCGRAEQTYGSNREVIPFGRFKWDRGRCKLSADHVACSILPRGGVLYLAQVIKFERNPVGDHAHWAWLIRDVELNRVGRVARIGLRWGWVEIQSVESWSRTIDEGFGTDTVKKAFKSALSQPGNRAEEFEYPSPPREGLTKLDFSFKEIYLGGAGIMCRNLLDFAEKKRTGSRWFQIVGLRTAAVEATVVADRESSLTQSEHMHTLRPLADGNWETDLGRKSEIMPSWDLAVRKLADAWLRLLRLGGAGRVPVDSLRIGKVGREHKTKHECEFKSKFADNERQAGKGTRDQQEQQPEDIHSTTANTTQIQSNSKFERQTAKARVDGVRWGRGSNSGEARAPGPRTFQESILQRATRTCFATTQTAGNRMRGDSSAVRRGSDLECHCRLFAHGPTGRRSEPQRAEEGGGHIRGTYRGHIDAIWTGRFAGRSENRRGKMGWDGMGWGFEGSTANGQLCYAPSPSTARAYQVGYTTSRIRSNVASGRNITACTGVPYSNHGTDRVHDWVGRKTEEGGEERGEGRWVVDTEPEQRRVHIGGEQGAASSEVSRERESESDDTGTRERATRQNAYGGEEVQDKPQGRTGGGDALRLTERRDGTADSGAMVLVRFGVGLGDALPLGVGHTTWRRETALEHRPWAFHDGSASSRKHRPLAAAVNWNWRRIGGRIGVRSSEVHCARGYGLACMYFLACRDASRAILMVVWRVGGVGLMVLLA